MTTKKAATAPIQILPNLEAEIGVLAILLSDNNTLPAIAEKLRPEHFGDTFHSVVYQAIATLISEGLRASPVTLRARIETHPTYAEVDGATYLSRLQKIAPPASEAMGYVTAILENHGRRTIVAVAEGMLTDALSSSTPIISVAEASTARLGAVTESLAGGTARKTRYTFEEAITQAIDHAAAAYQNEGAHPDSVMSGIRDLDRHMGGFMPGDLVVIAGRPGMGKSMLAANICYNAASHNKPAQFNSLEMNAQQLAVRQISSAMHHPKVPYSRIMKGKFSDAEFASIVETARAIKAMPLEINDLDRASLAQIEVVATRYKAENQGFAVMAVDYLQIMATASGGRTSNRTEEIGAITAGLKQLGKRLGIPILALSQVSRQVEQREDKRPTLADLRESGSIEQDADVIIFPFREDYYLARQEPKPDTTEHIDWQDRMNRVRNTMELIVAKYKMGATTTIKVGVDMATNSITDINNDQGELL